VITEPRPGNPERVSEPERFGLHDELEVHTPGRAVAEEAPDVRAGFGGDDYGDVVDGCCGEGVEDVGKDGPVRDRDELFGGREGQGPEPRTPAAAEYEAAECPGAYDTTGRLGTRSEIAGPISVMSRAGFVGDGSLWPLGG
jgi:hypothetical protein